MKKGLIFQIFISLVFLLGWNFLHQLYQWQVSQIHQQSGQAKMIVFAEDYPKLKQLESELQLSYYIEKVTVESDTTLANSLIDGYNLGNVRDILVSYNLPNLMTIKFDGAVYRAEQRGEFNSFLDKEYPELNHTFDDDLWQEAELELVNTEEIYLIINLIYLVMMLFILILLRIHFEIKHNEFWQIFKSAGGKYNQRNIEFNKDSLSLCFIPMIIVVLTYYILLIQQIISFEIDYRIFVIEFGALVLVTLSSRIALWSKF